MKVPLPPPPCDICGHVHPHFTHDSQRPALGPGRLSRPFPGPLYRMHMEPKEVEAMVYGPMFKDIIEKRGGRCAAAPVGPEYRHPPYMKTPPYTQGYSGLAEGGPKPTKFHWVLLAGIALAVATKYGYFKKAF